MPLLNPEGGPHWNKANLCDFYRLLGFLWIQRGRVPGPGTAAEELHGCTGAFSISNLRNDSFWLQSVHSGPCIELSYMLTRSLAMQKQKGVKKNTINYHLMRMFPKVAGPRKKEGVLG